MYVAMKLFFCFIAVASILTCGAEPIDVNNVTSLTNAFNPASASSDDSRRDSYWTMLGCASWKSPCWIVSLLRDCMAATSSCAMLQGKTQRETKAKRNGGPIRGAANEYMASSWYGAEKLVPSFVQNCRI